MSTPLITTGAVTPGADRFVEHTATTHGDRVVCTCGDFDCASLAYTACSFALGRGLYCKGDVRFPATHHTRCPGRAATATPPGDGGTDV